MSHKQQIEWFTTDEKKPEGSLILVQLKYDDICLLDRETSSSDWRISIDGAVVKEEEFLKWCLIQETK